MREEGWKYIDAPRPELFSVDRDPGESENVAAAEAARVAAMRERVNGYSAATLEPSAVADREAAARLQALGYVGGGGGGREATRADPKDRRRAGRGDRADHVGRGARARRSSARCARCSSPTRGIRR